MTAPTVAPATDLAPRTFSRNIDDFDVPHGREEETTRWSQDAMNHIVELDLDVDHWRAMYFDLLKRASQREWKHNIRQLNNPTFEGEDSE